MDTPAYSPPRQMPASLRDTLKIILEEELYLSGIDFLTSLIAQGISTTPNATDNSDDNLTSTATPPPIYIPPAIHLTLLTTLLCHPTFTTHVSKKSDLDSRLVSPSSERLLLRLLSLAGPNSMGLHTAWDRWDGTPSGSNGLWATQRGGTTLADDAFEDNSLDLRLAGKESLFERAEDFWAVVGWGFSCACAEIGYGVDAEKARALRRRWGAWRRVLRVMVEGLERDWEERDRGEDGEEKRERLRSSLVVRWLPSKRGGAGYKRVVRAVMANGKGSLGMEWQEIWRDEGVSLKRIRERKEKRDVKKLVPLTKEEQKEARKREILEGGSTEDEEGDEDEEDGNWAGDSKRVVDPDGDHTMAEASDLDISKPDSATSAWGGIEAVLLRQRLLILLSSVCHHQQWIPLSTLHDELTDHLLSPNPSSISLPSIRLFTTSLVTNSSLSFTHLTSPPPSHIYLHPLFSSLLRTLLSSDAPSPSNYGALEDRGGLISPKVLVTCYLPYRAKAGTLKDNLKVSVLLEQLVRAIATEGCGVKGLLGEDGGAFLVGAMEDGLERRMESVYGGMKEIVEDELGGVGPGAAAGGRKRKRGEREREREKELREWQWVEERLRDLVEVICS
ncbi:hypothetical protein BGX38DRAFT_1259056 [Terfezia claveryi]|nr:hypothetical protein BGX38DRAFT_1259056 [Terfezia claveryi]